MTNQGHLNRGSRNSLDFIRFHLKGFHPNSDYNVFWQKIISPYPNNYVALFWRLLPFSVMINDGLDKCAEKLFETRNQELK